MASIDILSFRGKHYCIYIRGSVLPIMEAVTNIFMTTSMWCMLDTGRRPAFATHARNQLAWQVRLQGVYHPSTTSFGRHFYY